NAATYLALKSGVFDDAEAHSEAEARSSIAEREHLPVEQMVGFVDETLAVRELQVVKEHLARCEGCETAVDDLRIFKEQITPELERAGRHAPMGAETESRW